MHVAGGGLPRGRSDFRLLAVVAIVLSQAPFAGAGNGGTVSLPSPLVQVKHGMKLVVDCEWTSGFGYRPVRVELQTPRRFDDRTYTVQVGLSNWGNNSYVTVTRELLVPAGETTAAAVLLVPQISFAQAVNIRCLEGGREIEGLSTGEPLTSTIPNYGGENLPRMLFVGDAPPDVSELSFLAMSPYLNYGTTHAIAAPADLFSMTHRTPAQLSEEWLFYSGLDVVGLSLDDARSLATQQRGVWRALIHWARAGGTLCVYGAERDWSKLPEIEDLCGCPAEGSEAALALRGWTAASKEVFESRVIPAVEAATGAAQARSLPTSSNSPRMPKRSAFVSRPLGFGRVMALSAADPFPGKRTDWQWFVESLAMDETGSLARFGGAPGQPAQDFNMFLIADVGLPPIRMYRVLISLFVIVIGPLNYWLLRRWGRLHLFLFTVPLAALVTSLTLLGYALLSDGLGARLRARSLTRLDQKSGTAASLARLSYYVGLAPAQGMVFPPDTAVIPFELNQAGIGPQHSHRDMVWADQQYLTRGWLGSRMPTQCATNTSGDSRQALDISAAADGSRVIKNRLGTRIQELLLCDEAGRWHRGKQIAADAVAPLAAVVDKAATDADIKDFLAALERHKPELPDGMLVSDPGITFFGRRRSYYYQQPPTIVASMLDSGFSDLATEIRAGTLAPRNYIAIVDRPAEIAVGLDEVAERQSTHVIHGTW